MTQKNMSALPDNYQPGPSLSSSNDANAGTVAAIRQKALALLARREHSTRELSSKLRARGIEAGLIAVVISQLCQEDLLSDARFTEGFVHRRMANGYGPLRIRHELRERGVDDDTITRYLPWDEAQWLDKIMEARNKRFGAGAPTDYRARLRQARFLTYRGFHGEHVRRVLWQWPMANDSDVPT